eukprot:tig00020553_g10646.t1
MEEKDAREYLESKRIPQLLEVLSRGLVFARPATDDIRPWLIQECERLRSLPPEQTISLFYSDEDLDGLFTSLDPNMRGVCSVGAFVNCMSSLGFSVEPPGDLTNGVLDKSQFLTLARRALQSTSNVGA